MHLTTNGTTKRRRRRSGNKSQVSSVWSAFASGSNEILTVRLKMSFATAFRTRRILLGGTRIPTYGRHIFVLSLGSSREIQFRQTRTQQIETVGPKAGDLNFFPLHINSTHQHRVSPAEEENAGTRLSFVFFFKPPK